MEDPESTIQKIDRGAEAYASNPSRENGENLLRLISILKLAIGIYNFSELRYYSRLESQIERNLDVSEKDEGRDWSNHGKTLEEVLGIQEPEENRNFS